MSTDPAPAPPEEPTDDRRGMTFRAWLVLKRDNQQKYAAEAVATAEGAPVNDVAAIFAKGVEHAASAAMLTRVLEKWDALRDDPRPQLDS